jgi:TolA-binding protein
VSFERHSSDLDARIARSVGRLVSASGGGAISPEASEASFVSVEQRLAARNTRIRRMRVTLVCAAVVLTAAGGYWRHARPLGPAGDVITYRVRGGPALPPGSLIEAGGDSATTDIAFSDGTHVRIEPHTLGRVAELDRQGGRVALYEGRAHVNVRHRPNARWLFQAGPFEVHVRGTSFSMAWDPATAHFELRMENGVVSVTGPLAGGEVVLHAGEALSIGLHDREASATSSRGSPQGPSVESTARRIEERELEQPAPDLPAPQQRRSASVSGTRLRAPMDWRKQLAEGHASAVVASAERRGIDRVLESATSEDLAALADAARYVGRDDLARRALLVQRRRFPGSSRAAEALFLLGRLEGESAGGAPRALAWYDSYLAEAPDGAYVSEALGRKMMVLERNRRHDEAMRIASDYVRRFPSGSYAHAARALIDDAGAPPSRTPPRAP